MVDVELHWADNLPCVPCKRRIIAAITTILPPQMLKSHDAISLSVLVLLLQHGEGQLQANAAASCCCSGAAATILPMEGVQF